MATKARYRPLSNRILVAPQAAEEVSRGGIVLPDAAREKPRRGEVLRVGPGRLLEDGRRVLAVDVKPGDVILYGRYHGEAVEDPAFPDGLLFVRDEEVIAVVEP